MVLRRSLSLRSDPLLDMTNFAAPGGDFRYTSQGPVDYQTRVPFDGSKSDISSETFAHISAAAATDLVFPPWLLEVPPYNGPESRTSSVSGSDYISTPQYLELEQSDLSHLTEQTHLPSMDYMSRDSNYFNNQQLTWSPPLTRGGGVQSQRPVAQSVLPIWHQGNYDNSSVPVAEYHASSFAANATSSLLQSLQDCKSSYRSPNLATCKASYSESTDTDIHSDGDDSEYEESSTEYSQYKTSRSSSASMPKASSIATPVLKLGKWSMSVDPFNQPAQRLYVCPLDDKSGTAGRHCNQSFARPEHLRRHMKTVHGTERNYRCKLPQCKKAFSRGDNLRDHYWTHIQRGGRIGKNDKMSLDELKEFLGPKEKRLIKKLKEKLSRQKVKERCKL